MSTELLASKVISMVGVNKEEPPGIPTVRPLPSAVCMALGVAERGPIADPQLLTSFEGYVCIFGGFTTHANDLATQVRNFFLTGGAQLWASRTCHFTDITDASTYTAATGSVMLQNAGTADTAFGLDNDLHTGSDATPEDTLEIEGKYPGAYTDNITIQIAAASSGEADEFNLSVLVSGVQKELFFNLTMGDGVMPDLTMSNYIKTIINNAATGSKLIQVTDQLLAYTAANKRPANGTSTALAGGDDGLSGLVDVDFTGDQAGETGLFTFDRAVSGTFFIVPGRTSAAVQTAMQSYAETTRNGKVSCVLDYPAGLTAAGVNAWAADNGILEASEFGAAGPAGPARLLPARPRPGLRARRADARGGGAEGGPQPGLWAPGVQAAGRKYDPDEGKLQPWMSRWAHEGEDE